MERFTTLSSIPAPLPQDDVDTDIIYPARFLLITDREGLDRYGFHDWRFDADGREKADFPTAREPWKGSSILITGRNFGCGSSREHAPWALLDMGIRCVIAPSFGEIFYSNCFKNGILPIIVDGVDHTALMADAQTGLVLEVDLQSSEIRRSGGAIVSFSIEPARRDALINGWDEVDTVLARHSADIDIFEAEQKRLQPWLWAADATAVATTGRDDVHG